MRHYFLSRRNTSLSLGINTRTQLAQIAAGGADWGPYVQVIVGILLIILAIAADAHLHTPMFFFLANLSLTDTCFVSTTVPKMLANIWAQSQIISYTGCLSQLYFFLIFGMLEASLLAVMAYDRYKAICYPLHYIMVMSPGLCVF